MNKLWALLVLVGGSVGVVGFFVPFVHLHHADGVVFGSPSAFEIVIGSDAHWNGPGMAALSYAPALLLVLLGAAALKTSPTPKRAGAFALVIALLCFAAWMVWAYGARASKLVDLGIGGNALLVAALVSVSGAMVALLRKS